MDTNRFDGQLIACGRIKVETIDAKTGEVTVVTDKPNTLCKGAIRAMTRLASQSDPAYHPEYDKIWAIYVGDGTATPAASQTSLMGANIFRKAVDPPSVSVDTGIVNITMTLADIEANDIAISEVGIFSRGDNDIPDSADPNTVEMYARQLQATVVKKPSMSIRYSWTFQITT